MTTVPAFFALPVVEYSRDLILPDSRVMACALDKPRYRWAVMERKPDGTQDTVIAMAEQLDLFKWADAKPSNVIDVMPALIRKAVRDHLSDTAPDP